MPRVPTAKEAGKAAVSAALPLHVSAGKQFKDQGTVLRHILSLWNGRGTAESAKNANAAIGRMTGRALAPGAAVIKDNVDFQRGR